MRNSISSRRTNRRQPKLFCQMADSGPRVEIPPDPRLAGLAEPPPQCRAADHPFERRRQRGGIGRGDEDPGAAVLDQLRDARQRGRETGRSEEHTSELQSLTNLVCRLLLEKKNST